jgi:thiol:disulfide interchange protein DsbD
MNLLLNENRLEDNGTATRAPLKRARRWQSILLVVCLLLFGVTHRAGAQVSGKPPGLPAAASFADMTAVHAGDKATIAVVVDLAAEYHAQSHTPTEETAIPFVLKPDLNPEVTFGEIQYPKAEMVTYTLGTVSVFRGHIVTRLPITVKADAKPGPITISGTLRYQTCSDTICKFPEKHPFSVTMDVVTADQPTQANPAFAAAISSSPTTAPASTQPAGITNNWAGRHGKSFFGLDLAHLTGPVAFVVAFVIGLIFNAMPCVLPVLPLKIMGFYQASNNNRSRSLMLGTVFSAGLIASFGVLAICIVGLKVFHWGDLFKNDWFTAGICIVLTVMAISTFGFFTINVPNSMYAFTPRHDTYVGNFLFGILTAALSTPCTFGMFVGLLTWSLSQPSWLGVSVIMMVGVGMAAPYFVLSAFPEVARKFPRTGPWAEVVKQMMGFLLLATAIYFAQPFLQRFLSTEAFWWTLFGVVAAGGIFLIVRSIQLSRNMLPRVVCATLAVLLVVPSAYLVHRLTEKPYPWVMYSDKALADAIAAGKPVVIDFTAVWCGNCHYLEATALHDSDVVDAVHKRGIVMLQADVTNADAAGIPLLGKLNPVGSIPLTAVYLPNIPDPRLLDGIYSSDDLVDALNP